MNNVPSNKEVQPLPNAETTTYELTLEERMRLLANLVITRILNEHTKDLLKKKGKQVNI